MGKVKSAKGKSKKSTWKKIHHPDIDTFINDHTKNEILGVQNKPSSELFFLDQLGFDDDFSGMSRVKKSGKKQFKRRESGPLVDLEGLKCFEGMVNKSCVRDPVVKRNPLKKGGGKKTLDMKLKDELRNYKRETRATKAAPNAASVSVTPIGDLWADSTDPRTLQITTDPWLPPCTKRHLLHTLSYKPNRKTTELPQIEPPHPGLSYNPSFQHHQQILTQAVNQEKTRSRAENKVIRATGITKCIGEGDTEVKEEKEEPEELETKPKLTKPKTKQQKRKEKEQKSKESIIQVKKLKVQQESQVYRVKSLKKQIEFKEKKDKVKLVKKIEKIEKRIKYGVKTLGKNKYQEVREKPTLSCDLRSGLRSSSGDTSGDLLLDRFKSLQKRNVIEPRVKVTQKRKNKLKKYTRDADKMEWEKTGVWNGEKIFIDNTAHRRKNQK